MPWMLDAKAFLGRIPRWAWIALAVAVLMGLGLHWYHKQLKAADRAGYARAESDIAAKALKLKAKMDALNTKISTTLRSRSDEDARHIAAVADTARLRGPGKAVCPGSGSVPSPARERVTSGGASGAAVDQVPDGRGLDLIALPFAGAIGAGEVCDLNRSEVLSWRAWHKQVEQSWPR